MSLKLAIQFVLFLVLALFATHRLDLLHDSSRSNREQASLRKLYANMDELERLRRHEGEIYAALDQHQNSLAGSSAAYLPDTGDTYSWTWQQIQFLAHESGVDITDSSSGPGPQLRSRRGDSDRQFSIFRCVVEFNGTLEQIQTFIQIAESRNPHLVVTDLLIGSEEDSDHLRHGTITLDWPTWQNPALREFLLTDINSIAQLPDD